MAASGMEEQGTHTEKVVLRHCSGATAEILLWGATLTSYKTANGQDRVFVSPAAIYDGKKAIRGGVPLVFPQFGQPDKAMPQHGVARISKWSIKEGSLKDSAEESCVVFTLSDSPESREKWDHAFCLEYTVSLSAVSLTMTLTAINTGDAAFNFNFLLHTYLQIPDIAETTVHGLGGRNLIDKVTGGDAKREESSEIKFPSFTDRIYIGEAPVAKDLTVKCKGSPIFAVVNEARVAGEVKPCDMVIWNPYEEASPGDLPPPAFKNFVCVEPGLVQEPFELPPKAIAQLMQKIMPL